MIVRVTIHVVHAVPRVENPSAPPRGASVEPVVLTHPAKER
jgi:hypothetical protein